MDNQPTASEQELFARILFPYAFRRIAEVRSNGTRFVHYTSADVAMRILRTREVWMRKSSCMNDFMEVQHGLNCVQQALDSDSGKRFKLALDRIFEGIAGEIEKLFNVWIPQFQANTHLTCVSEHLDDEDNFGRLSMWRAYGETTGVALVLNNQLFVTPSDVLKAYSSPVAYTTDLQDEIGIIAKNIGENADFIRAHSRDEITQRIFWMLSFAAVDTKHPGFAEEKEWRVIYCPTLAASQHMAGDIQVVKGVPQPIFKIPLRNIPEENFLGAEVSELLRECDCADYTRGSK